MPHHPAPEREVTMRFTSTPRGARLARRLVSRHLNDWGHPYTTLVNETLTLITAELTANAVRHGHVPGRDFHVQLTLAKGTFRIEVTDTRAEKRPPGDRLTFRIRPGHASGRHPGGRLGRQPSPGRPGQDRVAELHVRRKGHPRTHRVTPDLTDVDLLLTTASLLRDDLGSRPEDASHGGRRQ
ncbi:ATP-binding protein [Streptomyces sp. NPDC086766]|uniref:ATP-binding protein n=1 Tax=Streptomyces sp. NPDC086766 TaxID=3365754 RepID=UPI00380C5C20